MTLIQISPCWGWMNSDAYWRNATTDRAMQLNEVYKQIVKEQKFKNFNLSFYESPLQEVISLWKSMGGETWQLIEPVDGKKAASRTC